MLPPPFPPWFPPSSSPSPPASSTGKTFKELKKWRESEVKHGTCLHDREYERGMGAFEICSVMGRHPGCVCLMSLYNSTPALAPFLPLAPFHAVSGRVAMLAVVGVLLQEVFAPFYNPETGSSDPGPAIFHFQVHALCLIVSRSLVVFSAVFCRLNIHTYMCI